MTRKTPRPPRRDEQIVAATVAAALGVPVTRHDDGSLPGMYDFNIDYPWRASASLEVTTDVEPSAMATIDYIQKRNAGTWDAPQLSRSWTLHTGAAVPMRQLIEQAETLLLPADQAGVTVLDNSTVMSRFAEQHAAGGVGRDAVVRGWEQLRGYGAIRAMAHPTTDTAYISVHLQQGAGSWDGSADQIATWIGDFASNQACADNLRKLAGSTEAHLAVFAHMAGVDWSVWRALVDSTGTGVLPTVPPTLPAPLTHVWVFPYQGGSTVLVWSATDGWRRFPLVIST